MHRIIFWTSLSRRLLRTAGFLAGVLFVAAQKRRRAVRPQDTAAQAAKAMRDSGCGCAPVVEDTENLKLVGVVTERDICHTVAADDRKPSEVSVKEIMRPVSSCCAADISLEDAAQKLNKHQTTSLPVIDQAGSCCGTVSSHHIREKSGAVAA